MTYDKLINTSKCIKELIENKGFESDQVHEALLETLIDENKQINYDASSKQNFAFDPRVLCTFVEKLISKNKLTFPYKKYYVDIDKTFNDLVKREAVIVDITKREVEIGGFSSLNKAGQTPCIKPNLNSSDIYYYFRELEKDFDGEKLWKEISHLRLDYKVNSKILNDDFYYRFFKRYRINYLKPSIVKDLFFMLGSKRILDVDMGQAECLIGALSVAQYIDYYVGFGFPRNEMTKILDKFANNHKHKFSISDAWYRKGEEMPVNRQTFDMVFFRPPVINYTDFTRYAHELLKYVNEIWERLEPGGYFMIHLHDMENNNLNLTFYHGLLFRVVMLYMLAYLKGADYYGGICFEYGKQVIPMVVFRKINTKKYDPQWKTLFTKEYGHILNWRLISDGTYDWDKKDQKFVTSRN